MLPLSGRIDPSLDDAFVTPFYLLESLAHLALRRLRRCVAAHDHADAGARPSARRDHHARPEGIPARGDGAGLCAARAAEGHVRLRLVLQEALRNAVAPTLALTGVQFTFLIGGTVIVERIFAYPGIGNMAIDAVINRDLPLIQGLTLVFGALFIVVNMVCRSACCGDQSETAPWLTLGRLADERAASRAGSATPCALASRDPKVVVGGGFILFLLVLAIFAPWLAPKDPLEQDLILGATPPPAWRARSRATCSAPTISAAMSSRA